MYPAHATSDESPFRFLVLAGPVQAMDPTKVDKLAAVLADLARTRQVIVHFHDDRLAQARMIGLGQAYGSDPEHVAYRAETAWSRLPAACRHHAYELGPSLSEARMLTDEVTWLSEQ